MCAPVKLYFASSNAGKLGEFRQLGRALSADLPVLIEALSDFQKLPEFREDAPTFAENALGKALHYSRLREGLIFTDDSGLVVPALGGRPGVHSARYAGEGASDAEHIEKLLREMAGRESAERGAYFVCALGLARAGRALAAVTDRVDGEIAERSRGSGGFGYDPVFVAGQAGKRFSEMAADEKNAISHRGKALRKLLAFVCGQFPTTTKWSWGKASPLKG